MRTTTLLTSLGLALALGAGVAAAQSQTPPAHARAGQAEGQRRGGGRGGPDGFLLKGITLNADQQARVADLRKQWRAERPNQGQRDEQRQDQTRQQGARPQRTPAQRAAMQQRMEQHAAALRAILTPDQQRTFDANLAQMKQRFAQRGQNGGQSGWRHNSGQR